MIETHLDSTLSPRSRAQALLGLMTLSEKAHQLTSVPVWWLVTPDGREPAELADTLEKAPGHIANFGIDSPTATADVVGRLQRTVLEGTRLAIPLLVHTEALNGILAGGHMVFPTPAGLASTWSPDLVEEMAETIRRQMLRVGIRHALSPNLDIALDPRWGRMHETYGEDPYLVAAMSVAYIRGMQGADLSDGVIATAKHFIGYGLPEGGVNLSAFEAGPRRTRDLYAFPFEAAIHEAGLASVMNAYADVDGVPAGASSDVLTGLLRDTLGFEGFVSSDYMTLEHLVNRQQAARTPGEAGALAIAAGLDTEFPTPYGYGDALVREVEAGRADIADVDRSVLRVLEAKFRLGLFENPFPTEHIDLSAVAEEGRELSAELASRAVVMLRNDGTLPLSPGSLKVAVVGPHADSVTYQFATYSYPAFREMTQYMSSGGMGNMVGIDPGMASWNAQVFSDQAVADYVREELGARSLADAIADFTPDVVAVPGSGLTTELSPSATDAAVKAAAEADIVVLALGGASLWFNGERTEGEGSDSADISLPDAQVRLAEAVAATGTPTVVVLVQGRPYALPPVIQNASAIVVTSYNGPFGPTGVADVLFGRRAPEGKLPYSIPRHSGQIPVYHHQRAGTGYRNPLPPDVSELYLDMPATPLYPFAHGLTYTDFRVSDVVADPELRSDGKITVSAQVTNIGERDGVAVTQLYLRASAAGVTRPAQQLAGFTRVHLSAGESAYVSFQLSASQLGFTNRYGRFVVEPGAVQVWIGLDSSQRESSQLISVIGEERELSARDRVFFSTARVQRKTTR